MSTENYYLDKKVFLLNNLSNFIGRIFMTSTILTKQISKLSFMASIVFFMAIPLTGCYQSISLKTAPPYSDALLSNQAAKPLPAAYLMSIQADVDGTYSNINATFEQRFVGRLQESGVFSDVVGILGREKRSNEPHYNLFLKISEIQHFDRAGNIIKAVFVGASLYVLSPILPFDYGHEVKMTLTVQKPNGIKKEYVATAETSALYTLTHQQTAIPKAMGDATEKCIISVVNQLAVDGDLRSF
jgi:hypothetical protein